MDSEFNPFIGKWVHLFEAQQCLRKAQGWMTNSPEDFDGIELAVVRFAMQHMRQADEMLESVIKDGKRDERALGAESEEARSHS